MSGIKGQPSQKKILRKIDGYSEDQSLLPLEFVTVQNIGSHRHALDTITKFAYDLSGADDLAEANSSTRVLKATAHGGRVGDFVRFLSGSNNRMEVQILSVPDANTIILGDELDTAIGIGDSFRIFRYITQAVDQNGQQLVTFTPPSENIVAYDYIDMAVENVTTAAYTEVIADIGATAGKKIKIFYGGGKPAYLGFGAAAAEVPALLLPPGGIETELVIPANTRLSVKALGANVTSGLLVINVVG